jgi:hypothetical protein
LSTSYELEGEAPAKFRLLEPPVPPSEFIRTYLKGSNYEPIATTGTAAGYLYPHTRTTSLHARYRTGAGAGAGTGIPTERYMHHTGDARCVV